MKTNLILASLFVGLVVSAADARDLTIASWGGTYTEKQRAAIIDPFAKEQGIKVLDATFTGGLGQIRAMSDANNVTWDVVQIETADMIAGCAEGLFEKLDRSLLQHLNQYPPQLVSECGLASGGYSVVIGYNTKLTGDAPKSWKDFWNVKSFPGKRALRRSPQWSLEAALLADGVPANEVYQILSTPSGVDRAFKKLDEIKPNILWWEAGSQPAEWLASNNVAMSTSYVGRLIEAKAQNAPVAFGWKDAVYMADYWAILANSGNLKRSYDFLNYASDAKPQAAFSNIQPIAPVNGKAVEFLDAGRSEIMPVGKNLDGQLYIDGDFWAANLEPLTERFNAWLQN